MLGFFLASLSVGLSNFSASIGIGISGVSAKVRTQIAIIFGVFEGVMPVIGLLIGKSLSGFASEAGRYIGGTLLICIGLFVFWQSRSPSKIKEVKYRLDLRHLLSLGFVLSLDNLVIGLALGFYHISIILAACIIAGVSIGMSLIGLELGNFLGKRFEKWSENIAAVLLVLVGVIFLLGYL